MTPSVVVERLDLEGSGHLLKKGCDRPFLGLPIRRAKDWSKNVERYLILSFWRRSPRQGMPCGCSRRAKGRCRRTQNPQQLITPSATLPLPRQHSLICSGAEPIYLVHGPLWSRATGGDPPNNFPISAIIVGFLQMFCFLLNYFPPFFSSSEKKGGKRGPLFALNLRF